MRNFILIILMCALSVSSYGQYTGGSNDGYSGASYQSSFSGFNGGLKSGYTMNAGNPAIEYFSGGVASGYNLQSSDLVTSYFQGSQGDGYSASFSPVQTGFFAGGTKSGYTGKIKKSEWNAFAGGSQDGYHKEDYMREFIWTGAVGEGWNVADNWSTMDVPRIRHHVLIPDGVPNFPKLNAGLFTIGQNKNDGDYFCRSLTIQSNAEVTLRVNNYLENYGQIDVFGQIHVLSEISPAIRNADNGTITIHDGGTVSWE